METTVVGQCGYAACVRGWGLVWCSHKVRCAAALAVQPVGAAPLSPGLPPPPLHTHTLHPRPPPHCRRGEQCSSLPCCPAPTAGCWWWTTCTSPLLTLRTPRLPCCLMGRLRWRGRGCRGLTRECAGTRVLGVVEGCLGCDAMLVGFGGGVGWRWLPGEREF